MNNLAFRTYVFVLSSALLAGLEPPSAALQEIQSITILQKTLNSDTLYLRYARLLNLGA